MDRSGVQNSICGNDTRDVPADWLIAKKPRNLKKLILGAIKAVANKKLFAFAFSLYFIGSSTND